MAKKKSIEENKVPDRSRNFATMVYMDSAPQELERNSWVFVYKRLYLLIITKI